MNKSFKYLILILMISFLIAKLCSKGHQLYEKYTSYPFNGEVEENNNIEDLQTLLLKYNNIVSDSTKAGSIEYDVNMMFQEMNEEREQGKKERIIYSKLLDESNLSHTYKPYETILPDIFEVTTKEKLRLKGKRSVIIPEKHADGALESIGSTSLDTRGVKERSETGDIYYEPNNCKGYWSDWNTSSCGEEMNRCGIKSKRYEIVEPEKNDENGMGKPCDYKDGEIKYKYCVGNGNDDYDSNMERCDVSINSCKCKLVPSVPPVIEGENVYDLDGDCNYELNIDCICPSGYAHISPKSVCKLEPGVDCSVKEPGCVYEPPNEYGRGENCKIPEFINEEAKNNFYKKYNTVTGKCKEKECSCENGTPVPNEECPVDGMEMCDLTKACNVGYYYKGNPPTCVKRESTKNECSCLYGEPVDEGSVGIRCPQNVLDGLKEGEEDVIRQYCAENSCPTGYEYIPTSQISRCDEYYPNQNMGGPFDNLSCCLPKYDKCELIESELVGDNIVRKELSGDYQRFSNMTLLELINQYQEKGGTDTQEDILGNDNPKEFLMQYLIETSDTEETEQCFDQIRLEECSNSFKCNEGYSFLPNSNYLSDSELRIVGCESKGEIEDICIPKPEINECSSSTDTDCMIPSNVTIANLASNQKCRVPTITSGSVPNCNYTEGTGDAATVITDCMYKQIEKHYPMWNGTCVPVSCPVSDDIKEVYKLSFNSCSSENKNCGLSTVSCSEDKYNVPNTNRMVYCRAPREVGEDYSTTDYELIEMGCAKEPPELSEAVKAKMARWEQVSDSMIGVDDASIASERVSQAGITEAEIDERADFIGSTDTLQDEYEMGQEDERMTAEEQLDERSQQNSDVIERGIAAGISRGALDITQARR